MARDKHSRGKGNQFTAREKILLGVLVAAALIYAYFNLFLLPTQEQIAVLKTEKSTLEDEYQARNALISQKGTLAEQLAENSKAVNGYKNQYFKTANQEHFIKVLETELLDDEDLKVSSLSFAGSQPASEFVSTEVTFVAMESSVISFPFEGSYENLVRLTDKLEQYKNIIRINAMDITYLDPSAQNNGEGDSLDFQKGNRYQGNITVEFFTIPQEYEYPWDSSLPSYDRAESYNGSLFTYDDGGEGIPPFLIAEKNPDDGANVGGEEPGTSVGGITDPVNPGNPGSSTDPDDDEDPDDPGSGSTDPGDDEDPDDPPSGSTDPDDDEDSDDPASGNTDRDDEDKDPDLIDEGNPYIYVVLPGDTIYSISLKFYQSSDYIEVIMAVNNITDSTKLRIGTELKLPYLGK